MLEAWKFHENVLAVAPCGPNIKGLVRPDGHHSRPAEAAADRRRPQLLGRSCGCSCRRSARQSRSASLELLQLRRRCCRRRRPAAASAGLLWCPSARSCPAAASDCAVVPVGAVPPRSCPRTLQGGRAAVLCLQLGWLSLPTPEHIYHTTAGCTLQPLARELRLELQPKAPS